MTTGIQSGNTENGTAQDGTAQDGNMEDDNAQDGTTRQTKNASSTGAESEQNITNSGTQSKHATVTADPAEKKAPTQKVAGLPLNNFPTDYPARQTGKKAPGSLQNRLSEHQTKNQLVSRRKKVFLYGLSALALGLIGLYFYNQIRNLIAESHTGLHTPGKPVRLDSTAQKIDSPAKSYEKELKNRYQDSLQDAIQSDAMGHIVMDWSRLYDVNRYEKKNLYDQRKSMGSNALAASSGQTDTLLTASQPTDSQLTLAQMLNLEKALSDSAANAANKSNPMSNTAAMRQSASKKATAASKAPGKIHNRLAADYSLFNVVHGNIVHGSNSIHGESGSNPANGNRVNNVKSHQTEPGAETGNEENKMAGMKMAETVIVRAVVHGNHKVRPGSKVAFRLLEPVSFQGSYFEKNTILIAIATFPNGRVSFSNFRSKSLSSVSASHGPVASTPLPLVCYDTDMVAGISVSDQSQVETQTRQAGSSALSDAANQVSYSIPYGSLARAASSLTRGVANGKRQMREMFIDLADNYPVLLELDISKAMPSGQQ